MPGCRDRPRGIVGINLGAGRDSEDRIADYVTGIERMAQVASYFTINISSPNTPGLRDLQAPEALDALLKRVQAARSALARAKPPLLVKLAPDLADADLPEVVARDPRQRRRRHRRVEHHARARGLERRSPSPRRPAACRAVRCSPASTRMLARVYQLTQGKLPLIGVGGIDSGEAALAKIEAGASLLQLYTGLVFEGPGLIGRIKQALVEAMAKRRIRRRSRR